MARSAITRSSAARDWVDRVLVEAGVANVSLSFQWGKAKATDVVRSYSIGTKLEWRGRKDKEGFKPYAVLVTAIVRNHDTEEKHNVLGVIRIEPRNACLMAAVDEAANANAMSIARVTADRDAPAASCTRIKPKIVGVETRWAKEAIGQDGEAPK